MDEKQKRKKAFEAMYNSKTFDKKIVIIGSGNVATHLAKILVKKGHEIVQFIGRNEIAIPRH